MFHCEILKYGIWYPFCLNYNNKSIFTLGTFEAKYFAVGEQMWVFPWHRRMMKTPTPTTHPSAHQIGHHLPNICEIFNFMPIKHNLFRILIKSLYKPAFQGLKSDVVKSLHFHGRIAEHLSV